MEKIVHTASWKGLEQLSDYELVIYTGYKYRRDKGFDEYSQPFMYLKTRRYVGHISKKFQINQAVFELYNILSSDLYFYRNGHTVNYHGYLKAINKVLVVCDEKDSTNCVRRFFASFFEQFYGLRKSNLNDDMKMIIDTVKDFEKEYTYFTECKVCTDDYKDGVKMMLITYTSGANFQEKFWDEDPSKRILYIVYKKADGEWSIFPDFAYTLENNKPKTTLNSFITLDNFAEDTEETVFSKILLDMVSSK